ncbi:MAG: MoaD/ThiS family protein [Bacteroidales bacterium]|nr:MoaD/ThiS family protein [Bacteroidales bacterium]
MVRVLYFGVAREITGKAEEELNAADTGSLKLIIALNYPEIRSVPFRLALNGTLLKEEVSLENGDKIALLPPFAGG